jgi:hypothetical protein
VTSWSCWLPWLFYYDMIDISYRRWRIINKNTIRLRLCTNLCSITKDQLKDINPTIMAGFIQVKFAKISYIGTLFKAWLIQDSVLFMVRFKQVSLYLYKWMCIPVLFHLPIKKYQPYHNRIIKVVNSFRMSRLLCVFTENNIFAQQVIFFLIFGMQTFLRGLIYVRWAIKAHLSL